MKQSIIVFISMVLATLCIGQEIKVSKPDSFGAQYVTGPNGIRGKVSGPDSFGARYFRFSNGESGKISGPDSFGSRRIRFNRHNTSPR